MSRIVVFANNGFAGFIAAALWITGIVLAGGFWSTFFAVICPPWGWYLVVYTALLHYGVI